MKIIEHSHHVQCETYSLSFKDLDCPGSGWSFDCDKNGKVDTSKLPQPALENYNKCKEGKYNVSSEMIITYHHSYWTDKIGQCDCGEKVVLSNFTNTCKGCNADYNMSGQRLARRSQWGYETGESWHECY